MNDVIQAIVLKTSEYKENDLLVYVLAKQYGKLTLICKGARKMGSKLNAIVQVSNCSEFIIDYAFHKSMFMIKSGKVIETYKKFSNDLELSLMMQLMVEIVYKLEVDEWNDELYELLLTVFQKITKENQYLLGCYFMAQLLSYLGIKPYVDSCVKCKNMKIKSISTIHGGFICTRCFNESEYRNLTINQLRKFRFINKVTWKDVLSLASEWYDMEDFKLLIEFLIHNYHLSLNTWDFLLSLNID